MFKSQIQLWHWISLALDSIEFQLSSTTWLVLTESSVLTIRNLLNFFFRPVNYASLIYKLCVSLQTCQDSRTFMLECI